MKTEERIAAGVSLLIWIVMYLLAISILLDGSPGVETGLVLTPAWWPFTYTTKDNLKRLKRQQAVIKVRQWVSWPEALF